VSTKFVTSATRSELRALLARVTRRNRTLQKRIEKMHPTASSSSLVFQRLLFFMAGKHLKAEVSLRRNSTKQPASFGLDDVQATMHDRCA